MLGRLTLLDMKTIVLVLLLLPVFRVREIMYAENAVFLVESFFPSGVFRGEQYEGGCPRDANLNDYSNKKKIKKK